MDGAFPGSDWCKCDAPDVEMDADMLRSAGDGLADQAGERSYRVVVVRHGRVVARWRRGVSVDERLNMASATKSLFASMLGIAVSEGKIGSADDRAADYFPEMLNVPPGKGPKEGRFAKGEDSDITLRQLICNTSGYMKPGETPGRTFHYQTFGMNVLCHAISSAYGLYDSSNPDRLAGMGKLIEDKIRNPIGGTWGYRYCDFEHPPGALTNIFGHSPRCDASALDMARMGLLWLNFGRWGAEQIIDEQWMRTVSRTNDDILTNCPRKQRHYGHGFWTNDFNLLWANLPGDCFAASGAGRKHALMCPSLDLVVSQSPGIWDDQTDESNTALLERIVGACK